MVDQVETAGAARAPAAQGNSISEPAIAGLGVLYILIAVLACYVLVAVWPSAELTEIKGTNGVLVLVPVETPEGRAVWKDTIDIFRWSFRQVDVDLRLFMLVIVSGVLGAFVHSATSFADYVGNQRLTRSWVLWLLLRIPIGGVLAIIVYLLIRGGLLVGSSGATALQPFGVGGIAAMTGLFSKQATDKLREVFDTLFRTENGDNARSGKLENPAPVLLQVSPEELPPTGGEVRLRGHGFVADSMVQVGGRSRPARFVNDKELAVEITPAEMAAADEIDLRVDSPGPGGGRSAALALRRGTPGG